MTRLAELLQRKRELDERAHELEAEQHQLEEEQARLETLASQHQLTIDRERHTNALSNIATFVIEEGAYHIWDALNNGIEEVYQRVRAQHPETTPHLPGNTADHETPRTSTAEAYVRMKAPEKRAVLTQWITAQGEHTAFTSDDFRADIGAPDKHPLARAIGTSFGRLAGQLVKDGITEIVATDATGRLQYRKTGIQKAEPPRKQHRDVDFILHEAPHPYFLMSAAERQETLMQFVHTRDPDATFDVETFKTYLKAHDPPPPNNVIGRSFGRQTLQLVRQGILEIVEERPGSSRVYRASRSEQEPSETPHFFVTLERAERIATIESYIRNLAPGEHFNVETFRDHIGCPPGTPEAVTTGMSFGQITRQLRKHPETADLFTEVNVVDNVHQYRRTGETTPHRPEITAEDSVQAYERFTALPPETRADHIITFAKCLSEGERFTTQEFTRLQGVNPTSPEGRAMQENIIHLLQTIAPPGLLEERETGLYVRRAINDETFIALDKHTRQEAIFRTAERLKREGREAFTIDDLIHELGLPPMTEASSRLTVKRVIIGNLSTRKDQYPHQGGAYRLSTAKVDAEAPVHTAEPSHTPKKPAIVRVYKSFEELKAGMTPEHFQKVKKRPRTLVPKTGLSGVYERASAFLDSRNIRFGVRKQEYDQMREEVVQSNPSLWRTIPTSQEIEDTMGSMRQFWRRRGTPTKAQVEKVFIGVRSSLMHDLPRGLGQRISSTEEPLQELKNAYLKRLEGAQASNPSLAEHLTEETINHLYGSIDNFLVSQLSQRLREHLETGDGVAAAGKALGLDQRTSAHIVGRLEPGYLINQFHTIDDILANEIHGINNPNGPRKKQLRKMLIDETAGIIPSNQSIRYLGLEGVNFRSYTELLRRFKERLDNQNSLIVEQDIVTYNVMQSIQQAADVHYQKQLRGFLDGVTIMHAPLRNALQEMDVHDYQFNVINLDFMGQLTSAKEEIIRHLFEKGLVAGHAVIAVSLNENWRQQAGFRKEYGADATPSEDQEPTQLSELERTLRNYAYHHTVHKVHEETYEDTSKMSFALYELRPRTT